MWTVVLAILSDYHLKSARHLTRATMVHIRVGRLKLPVDH